ncbi:MAG: sigma-70 family RNA polymerase sigma factor [Clostridia bacterium]|nr:sigma-70 family RNA polymerase sigma factor [Clostridia bacterium]
MTHREELLFRAAKGDRRAEGELLELNGGLIRAVARRFSAVCAGRGIEEADLFQLASIGFIKAVRNFDLDSGYALSTYAVPKMMGEIRRFLRDDGLIRVGRTAKERAAKLAAGREKLALALGREPTVSELAGELGLEPEEIAEALEAIPALDGNIGDLDTLGCGEPGQEETVVERLALRGAVSTLSGRDRVLLELRYRRGLTQAKTAGVLGMTQVQVSRAEKKAIAALKTALGEG